ncbi:MAG: DUF4097 family beta strand repeat protein [Catenulispora sp.]|nr:DUF4097 family beta strand repeat protein [Catenulispora sp.]
MNTTPSPAAPAVTDPPAVSSRFSTPAPISALLLVPAGRIEVLASDRADTTVEVRAVDRVKKRDVKAAQQTVVEYTDGVLRIEVPTGVQLMGPSGSVMVSIRLPSGSHVDAKVDSTDLRCAGRLQTVTFDGALGTIELEEAAGARVTSAVGDVTVGRLAGDAHVSTAQGDIRIDEAVRGRLILRTQVGSVSVAAPAGVSVSLDAGTTVGRIRNALENTGGTPAVIIRATTVKGDITARSIRKERSGS